MAVQYQLTQVSWPGVNAAASVTVTVTAPDGTSQVLQATSGSQETPNNWSAWFTPQEQADYTLLWTASGGQTWSTTLPVQPPAAVQDVISLEDCYATLKMPAAALGKDPSRDADMLFYARAATRVVEGIVGPVAVQTLTEVFDGGGPAVLLHWRPTAIVSIMQNGSPATGWVPDFPAGMVYAGYFGAWWTPGIRNIRVTYMVGSGRVRENVLLGIREVFRQVWERSRAMGGAASGDMVMQGFAVPNAVYELLAAEPMLPGFA
jgi:hypothetical protein